MLMQMNDFRFNPHDAELPSLVAEIAAKTGLHVTRTIEIYFYLKNIINGKGKMKILTGTGLGALAGFGIYLANTHFGGS
jgi:hypothetical protein